MVWLPRNCRFHCETVWNQLLPPPGCLTLVCALTGPFSGEFRYFQPNPSRPAEHVTAPANCNYWWCWCVWVLVSLLLVVSKLFLFLFLFVCSRSACCVGTPCSWSGLPRPGTSPADRGAMTARLSAPHMPPALTHSLPGSLSQTLTVLTADRCRTRAWTGRTRQCRRACTAYCRRRP